MLLEIAQLANCDSGAAETLEMDESISVSFPVTMLLLLNWSKEKEMCCYPSLSYIVVLVCVNRLNGAEANPYTVTGVSTMVLSKQRDHEKYQNKTFYLYSWMLHYLASMKLL